MCVDMECTAMWLAMLFFPPSPPDRGEGLGCLASSSDQVGFVRPDRHGENQVGIL